MMEVVTSLIVAKLGIDLSAFITRYLDEIIPVHNWSYLILEAIGLLYLLIWRNHHPLVLDFLTGSLCAIV